METVEYKNLKFTIWDVGGQPKLRPLWKHYYLNTQAVIYVIDSSDESRLTESHDELVKLISEKVGMATQRAKWRPETTEILSNDLSDLSQPASLLLAIVVANAIGNVIST